MAELSRGQRSGPVIDCAVVGAATPRRLIPHSSTASTADPDRSRSRGQLLWRGTQLAGQDRDHRAAGSGSAYPLRVHSNLMYRHGAKWRATAPKIMLVRAPALRYAQGRVK
jgi:hypothetical protein